VALPVPACEIVGSSFGWAAASVMQNRSDEAKTHGGSQTGDLAAALRPREAGMTVLPPAAILPSPLAVEDDDAKPAVTAFRRPLAENDNASAPGSGAGTPASSGTSRFHYFTTPFGFALALSLVWVAAVSFANVYLGSLALQLFSAGGPIAIFCAMQYWRYANESMKNRIRALEQERADADKADRLAQLAAKAKADLATLDAAVEKTIGRSVALSDTVNAEVQRLEGASRESEGLLAGLIQSAVEAQIRAVSSHKQLQEAAAAEAQKLQALTGEVLASFETSGKNVIGEVTASLDSARDKVEALFDRRTADGERAFDARVKELTESLSTRESEYLSQLDALGRKADQRYDGATRAALEFFDRSAEAFSTQLARQNAAVGALIEKRAAEIQGSLGAHATVMEASARTALESVDRSAEAFSAQLARQNAAVGALIEKRSAEIQGSLGAHATAMEASARAALESLDRSAEAFSAQLASQNAAVGALIEKRSAEIQGSLGAHAAAMEASARAAQGSLERAGETFSTQIVHQSAAVGELVDKRAAEIQGSLSAYTKAMEASARAALDSFDRAVEAFSSQLGHQNQSAVALVEKRAADIQGSLTVHTTAMDGIASTVRRDIEDTQKSILDAFSEVAPSLSGAGAKLLDGISGSIAKSKAQTDTAVALVEKRAADIQGSLGAHSAAMEGVAATLRRDIESSQKSILGAFSDVAPSLSAVGAKLLDSISGSVAKNKAQSDEAISGLMTAIDDFQKERESQIQGAVQEIASQMASSYGQIAVLFDMHGDEFANRLDERIEALRAELDERRRLIEEFLTTSRASLSEEALKRLEAFDQNMQNQAITLHSAMSVRLAEIDAMVTRIGDHVLYELGVSIGRLKGELPQQAEAFAREVSDAGSLVSSKADEMARTLEQSSSVFLEVLESRTHQLDKAIIDDGSTLVARIQETTHRLSEVMSETREALDADFRRNSSDAIASITSQNEQIEAMFNKAVQSAIDQTASHIDFLMETIKNSASRLDQLIRVDGGELAAGLQDYAERTATDLQTAIDRIDALNQGQAEDWNARVNESANALVREIEAKLDNFDGHVDQKLHEVFESAARLIVRLQNGIDMKAGILNEMLGRRASELSKIIGTMIDGYANPDGPTK